MTREDAVNLAIAELGDGTSIEELRERSSEIYGRDICYDTAKRSRIRWRKRVGKIRDCRTHRDQPGRSEKDLFQVNKEQLKALFNFEATKIPTTKDIINLVSKFDSIGQFVNSAKRIEQLKVIKPFEIPKPK